MSQQKRRQYSAEYKQEAVRMSHEPGRTVASVARDLGINENNLWRWREQIPGTEPAQIAEQEAIRALQEENRQLRRALARAEEEREILKKTVVIFGPQK